jgi:hypothetical protein
MPSTLRTEIKSFSTKEGNTSSSLFNFSQILQRPTSATKHHGERRPQDRSARSRDLSCLYEQALRSRRSANGRGATDQHSGQRIRPRPTHQNRKKHKHRRVGRFNHGIHHVREMVQPPRRSGYASHSPYHPPISFIYHTNPLQATASPKAIGTPSASCSTTPISPASASHTALTP